jgi:uncharacterized membrane protein
MTFLILLMAHVAGATVALLAGFLAMLLRKGSGLHGAAGALFAVSMTVMSASAAYIAAFLRPNMINVVAGSLSLYLVATSWRAARDRNGRAGGFERAALLWVVATGAASIAFGFEAVASPSGTKDGMPAAIYFIFGTVALLHAVADARMLARGGVAGPQRIARHLRRMCLALLIASLSLYPGQARLFPHWLRATNLLFVPHILLAGSAALWMARMSRRGGPHFVPPAEARRAAVVDAGHA